jgi:hypothetical protein
MEKLAGAADPAIANEFSALPPQDRFSTENDLKLYSVASRVFYVCASMPCTEEMCNEGVS